MLWLQLFNQTPQFLTAGERSQIPILFGKAYSFVTKSLNCFSKWAILIGRDFQKKGSRIVAVGLGMIDQ